jgi:DNA-binding transcriptional MerR regulator
MKRRSRRVVTFYEPADCARVLGVASDTVHELVDRGVLPIAARTPRGVRLCRPADVERLACARKAEAK